MKVIKQIWLLVFSITLILVSCKKDIPVPAAPSALEGQVVSDTEIKLFWSDNSENETGFKIQRKTGNGLFTDIATVPSNTITYIDRGLNPKTNYQYRIYAFNSNNPPEKYTNEVDLKTMILIWDTVYSNSSMEFRQKGIVLNSTTAFIGANTPTSAKILKTNDAGKTWSIIDTKIPTLEIRSIAFQSETVGYVSLFAKGVYRTIDGGNTWNKINDCTCGLSADANSLSIIDQLNTYYSTDRGATFTQKSVSFTAFQNPISSFRFTNSVIAYFVEGMVKSVDGGINWTSANPQLTPVYSVTPINQTKWFAIAGNNGTLYQTTNAGSSWTQLTSNASGARLMAAKNDTLFVNKSGSVYWTLDGNSFTLDHDRALDYNLLAIGNNLIGFYNGTIVKRRY
jgi:photosystem II stability/assembly factor-like uncharacterized protein